eukprot:38554-Eustigmatos_ZCMA.PRE.1
MLHPDPEDHADVLPEPHGSNVIRISGQDPLLSVPTAEALLDLSHTWTTRTRRVQRSCTSVSSITATQSSVASMMRE